MTAVTDPETPDTAARGESARPAAPSPWSPRSLAVPLGIFAVSRVVQLTLIAWMLPAEDTVRGRLLAWDAAWFVRVARDGYPTGYSYDEGGTLVGNGLAFFPGYPLLVRGAQAITAMDYESAALAVSWIAGAVAVALIHALGTSLYDRRVGIALATLFCAQPMSVVLSMGYSEGLFVALVAGMFFAAHRRAWIFAGAFGLAAALTRPTGAAAALALAVAAYLAVREGDPRRWRAVAAATVALAGVPGYLLWVGRRVGEPTAWFDIQTAGWGSTFDYGVSSLAFVRDALRGGDGWIHVSVAWLLIIVVVAVIVALTRRIWPPLVVYGMIALVLVVGQGGYYHSKPRLLVPVLLILVPSALALGRARTSTAVAVLGGYAAFGLWYGAYLVAVWPYAI